VTRLCGRRYAEAEVGTSKEIHKVLAKTLPRMATRIGYSRSLQGFM
jgi:hypothetical protein